MRRAVEGSPAAAAVDVPEPDGKLVAAVARRATTLGAVGGASFWASIMTARAVAFLAFHHGGAPCGVPGLGDGKARRPSPTAPVPVSDRLLRQHDAPLSFSLPEGIGDHRSIQRARCT